MLKQFQKHIDKKFPFLQKSNVLIASSGGLDSTVLAHLFKQMNIKFSLAHCNFLLRGKESDKDETFVKNLGSFLNVPVYTTKFKTNEYADKNGISIQMAARELRYRWFEKTKNKHNLDYILTAHHKDDVLETFLINFTRGTGLDGLTGIPEINGSIIRPMLPFTRDEITWYAKKNDIIWREDESNSSTKYFRNKIRHKIVPIIKELNPNFFNSFDNTLINLNESKTLVSERTKDIKEALKIKEENETLLLSLPKILKLKYLKANLYPILKPYGFTNWSDIHHILKAQSGKKLISKTHHLLKNRDELIISPIRSDNQHTFNIPKGSNRITEPVPLDFKDVNSTKEYTDEIAYIDKNKLKHSFIVRKWKKGDYFYPIGMHGKKKLSKFFKDIKLSTLEKENKWLLCDGDDIVWIIGTRMDNRYKISDKTTNILEIKLQDNSKN